MVIFLRKVMLVIIFTAYDQVIQDVKCNTLFDLDMAIMPYRGNLKKTILLCLSTHIIANAGFLELFTLIKLISLNVFYS